MSEAPSITGALLDALHRQDAARPRSRQTAIGPSSIGGCRRQVWSQINGLPVTNPDTLIMAAAMGTAIHTTIEAALRRLDPWGERYLLEVAVEAEGLPGHVDCYDLLTSTAWDWKTITKKKAADFPTVDQRGQVQDYGWLLEQNGYTVEWVGLVGICRDGNENDVIEYVERYDPAVSAARRAWLAEVASATEPPRPERDALAFCADYCEFYDAVGEVGCPGRSRSATLDPANALDEGKALLVLAYDQARADVAAAEARQASLREQLAGVVGHTPDGLMEVWWTSSAGRLGVDREAVEAAMGEVPMKPGRPTTTLNVKPTKAAAAAARAAKKAAEAGVEPTGTEPAEAGSDSEGAA